MVTVELPFACLSYNTYYRVMRGRYIISQKGRDFRTQVTNALVGKPKTAKLELDFHFKDRRLRDLDNHMKALVDALKGNLFDDDSQIFEMVARKHIGVESKTIITVSAM
jgi:Holliday junction resolvase RusA-like endonuclease